MANILKQRYYPVEAGQEAARDVLSALKAQFVDILSDFKSGSQSFFSNDYRSHEPASRGINSDIVSVRMQHHFQNRR